MTDVLDMDGRRLDLRVVCEIGADKPPVPGPLILGVAGRVDAGEPAAGADEALEGGLLARVENVSRRAEEDDDPEPREFRHSEAAGVFRAVDAETMLGAQRFDRGNALRNRVVAKAGRLREDEDGEPRLGARGRAAEACQHAEETQRG